MKHAEASPLSCCDADWEFRRPFPARRRGLSAAERVYAEDTRHTQKLFNHFDIHTELRSLHQHNEASRAAEIKQSILNGGSVIALVTDAGTPGISDPGSTIVNALLAAEMAVIPVPGASSLSAALSVSGFDHGEFGTLWAGFLPQKRKARRDTLAKFERFPGVVVFLESPHRIEACADDLSELLGDRELVICRELTKKYETIYRTTCNAFPSLGKEAARGRIHPRSRSEHGPSRNPTKAMLSRRSTSCSMPDSAPKMLQRLRRSSSMCPKSPVYRSDCKEGLTERAIKRVDIPARCLSMRLEQEEAAYSPWETHDESRTRDGAYRASR